MSRHSSYRMVPVWCVLGLVPTLLGACQKEAKKEEPPLPVEVSPAATDPEPAPPSKPEAVKQDLVPTASGRLLAIEGNDQHTIRLDEVIPSLSPRVIESDDPYYQRMKRFWVVPAGALLGDIFKETPENLRVSTFVLKARDGYEVRFSGEKLLDPAAFFAFADAEHRHFLPISEQKAQPGPLYVVWEGERGDASEYPRPWGLASIERTKGDAGLEHTVPDGGYGDNARAETGGVLFKKQCIHCHSINQQGGKVGPDLNVPQNILAYRPEAQVRAYIRDPRVFRYSNMPPHPDLSDEDLDALIAYLKLMGRHQVDPHVDVTPENARDHN